MAIFAQWRVQTALIWGIVAGYVFLPEPLNTFEMPLLQRLIKQNFPPLVVFAIVLCC